MCHIIYFFFHLFIVNHLLEFVVGFAVTLKKEKILGILCWPTSIILDVLLWLIMVLKKIVTLNKE